jgi:hypothetical protein
LAEELTKFSVDKVADDVTLDWRQRPHDDLVLATAIACWTHEHVRRASVDFVAMQAVGGLSYQG